VLAVDLPSGIEANSGFSLPRCVMAHKTVTFTLIKAAHLLAHSRCGEICLRSIDIPEDIVEAEGPYVKSFDQAEAGKLLPKREANSHKGNYGKTLLLCGGKGYSGAACLASRAAVRAGAGIVTNAVPNCVYSICATASPEAITLPLEDTLDGGIALSALKDPRFRSALEGADAIGTGSGLLPVPAAKTALKSFLESGKKLVIDAGMLNFLQVRHNPDGSERIYMEDIPLHKGVVLTPHLGELSRILVRTGLAKQNPVTLALEVAQMAGAVLVLKGNRTVVASPDGRVFINTTGNPGMARGGSGDVLAGTIASLAARMDAFEAAALGVYLHGAAGDLAANRVGENGMTPGMMIDLLPEAARIASKGMKD
ncbi:MAG: NAD(P)H-hydrate dehydratase, partial [Clostridia bacterium]|nr:NAD(P)H-hydrate dehydratase [Clostridia bacterium]